LHQSIKHTAPPGSQPGGFSNGLRWATCHNAPPEGAFAPHPLAAEDEDL
jgi:hypothetical protein